MSSSGLHLSTKRVLSLKTRIRLFTLGCFASCSLAQKREVMGVRDRHPDGLPSHERMHSETYSVELEPANSYFKGRRIKSAGVIHPLSDSLEKTTEIKTTEISLGYLGNFQIPSKLKGRQNTIQVYNKPKIKLT